MATRRERVVLELEDRFTGPMLRAAAATDLLDKRVDALGRDASQSGSSTKGLGDDIDRTGVNARRASGDINQFSGRLGLIAQAVGALGPGLIPIAAVGIPAVTGLASSLGFAAIAGGTAIGAFQGVGDALEAMNKAHLEPTAENLAKAQQAMDNISPAAQALVEQLRSMGPEMKGLRDAAAEGMFPGLIDGLDAIEGRLPDVQRIIGAVAGELGNIASDSGTSLASGRWDEFFTFLETDAPSALRDLATGTGNVTHALTEMWMAFDPINDDFSSWLVGVTEDFDQWASGLSQTDGFAEFMDYLRTAGPQVADAMGAIGNAVLQIVQAAAPIGGPVLASIEAFADAVAAIADSDLGTPIFGMIAALSALNLALRATGALSRVTFGGPAVGQIQAFSSKYTSAFASVRTASEDLRKAEAARARAAQSAAGAQSALIPAGEKRGSVSNYMASVRAEEAATKRLNEAQRQRSAIMRQTAVNAGKAGAAIAGLAILTTEAGQSIGFTNTAALGFAGSIAGPVGAAVGVGAGAILDLSNRYDDLRTAAMASNAAVNSGDLADITKNYRELNQEIGQAKSKPTLLPPVSVVGLGEALMKYRAIKQAQDDLAANRGASAGIGAMNFAEGFAPGIASVRRFGGALADLDNDMLSTAKSAGQLSAALASLIGPGLNAEEATDKYVSTLQSLHKELRKGADFEDGKGGGFDGYGKKAMANREVTRLWMNDFSSMISKQAEAGAGAAKIGRQVRQAREDFIREGVAAGISAKAMRARANALGLTPKLVRTVMRVVNAKAVDNISRRLQSIPREKLTRILAQGIPKSEAGMRQLQKRYNLTPKQVRTLALLRDSASPIQRRIMAALNRLDGKTATPSVNARDNASGTIRSVSSQLGAINGRAAWTTIYTVHKSINKKADGGMIHGPGGPREDKVPILASNGEFIVNAAATARNRALLESINANRYANGGGVGRVSVAAPSVNVGAPNVIAAVYLDGKQIDARVDLRVADHRDMDGMKARTN